MNKFFFLHFCIATLVFAGCETGNLERSLQLETEVVHEKEQAKIVIEPKKRPFQQLEFINSNIPKILSFEGKVVDGAHWKDKAGTYWLLISEKKVGISTDSGYVSNLYAACWHQENEAWNEVWKIKDFNQADWQSRSYVKGSLKLSDNDQDSLAESLFMYELGHDGNDPTDFKLMLHVRNEKYAIRGTLASESEGIEVVERMVPDKSFDAIAPVFKDYALKEWNDFRTNWNKRLEN